MRIAVVHGYYSSRQPSGENVVVDLQAEALRRGGHDVRVIGLRQDVVERERGYLARASWHAATGRGPSPLDEVAEFGADVVHVHNLFPNYGRRWVARSGTPVVATLHNYRPLCPAAILYRDGRPCTDCPDAGHTRSAVRHACYRSSRVATVPIALGTRFADDPVLAHARRIVALHDPMREVYVAAGVSQERVVTVPNFVPDPPRTRAEPGEHWLYVGRLSEEKGLLHLLRAWPRTRRLIVVGGGPAEAEARRIAGPGVEFRGLTGHDEVLALLASARGLVFPSRWPEGLPTVYLEALSVGVPVVATAESVVGRLVRDQGTGVTLAPGALDDPRGDLEAALAQVESEHPRYAAAATAAFAARYTESAWLGNIQNVYTTAITEG